MIRHILRRLALLPVWVLLANFAGFFYARLASRAHLALNPFGSRASDLQPVWPDYLAYLRNVLKLDFGPMPVAGGAAAGEALGAMLAQAAIASLGLLLLSFALSLVLGLLLGFAAVRIQPARVAGWLVPAASAGYALPSFYLGAVVSLVAVRYVLAAGEGAAFPLPLQGYGWDLHLVLPVLVLLVRPTLYIAHITATQLAGELDKQYIVAARSRGHTWRTLRRKHALRNVLAPVALGVAGGMRQLVAELVVVEWFFAWPGLGRLLALTLVPSGVATLGGFHENPYFLHAQFVAAVVAAFALLFLLIDLLAVAIVNGIDPRYRLGGQS